MLKILSVVVVAVVMMAGCAKPRETVFVETRADFVERPDLTTNLYDERLRVPKLITMIEHIRDEYIHNGGGSVDRVLSSRDSAPIIRMLITGRVGDSDDWENPETGEAHSVRLINKIYPDDGSRCVDFELVSYFVLKTGEVVGYSALCRACIDSGGDWHITLASTSKIKPE